MLNPVTILSSNEDTTRAIPGDTVTLRFTASENIRQPILSINGNAAPPVRDTTNNNMWSATRTITADDLDRESNMVQFVIDYTDMASIAGSQVTTTTDGSQVTMTMPDATIMGTVCVTAQFDATCDTGDQGLRTDPPYMMYIERTDKVGDSLRSTEVNPDTGEYRFDGVTPGIQWNVHM